MKVFKKIPQELDVFDGQLMVAVIGSDEKPLRSTNAWLDWRLFGTMTELIVRGVFKGEFGEKCLIPTYGKFGFDRLVMLGAGSLFDDSVYPTSDAGRDKWQELGKMIEQTIRSLRTEKVGLSLPRFDLVDHERALLTSLQASPLKSDTALFVARAAQNYSPSGFSI